MQPLAYMSLHIALTTATFAVTKIFWDSYIAHTAFLLFVFCWAVWNGEVSSLVLYKILMLKQVV